MSSHTQKCLEQTRVEMRPRTELGTYRTWESKLRQILGKRRLSTKHTSEGWTQRLSLVSQKKIRLESPFPLEIVQLWNNYLEPHGAGDVTSVSVAEVTLGRTTIYIYMAMQYMYSWGLHQLLAATTAQGQWPTYQLAQRSLS